MAWSDRPAKRKTNPALLFYTDKTKSLLLDEQIEFFNEVTEPGSGFKEIKVNNFHNFKTQVNLAIAEFENERRFMRGLVDPANVGKYDALVPRNALVVTGLASLWTPDP
jgi:hypothetical protein